MFQRLFTGMVRERISSLGAWRDTERVSWSFLSARSYILSTRPQVEREMWRMLTLSPSSEVTSSKKRSTFS